MPRDSDGHDEFYGAAPSKPPPPPKRNLNVTCPPDVADWIDEQLVSQGRQEGEERRVTDVVLRALRFQRDAMAALGPEWWEIMKLTHTDKLAPGVVLARLSLEALEARREKALRKREAEQLLEGKK